MPELDGLDQSPRTSNRHWAAGRSQYARTCVRLCIALATPLFVSWLGFAYVVAALSGLGLGRSGTFFSSLFIVLLAWPLLSVIIWVKTAPKDSRSLPSAARRRNLMLPFHGWFGLVFGGLAYVIMFTGALCVYDQEIDHWMQPETRLVQRGPLSLDMLQAFLVRQTPDAERWVISLPNERRPFVAVTTFAKSGNIVKLRLDSRSIRPLPQPSSLAATGFFLQLHSRLLTRAWNIGYWLTTLTGVVIMSLSLSGFVLYPRILADAFTLRLDKGGATTATFLHRLGGIFGTPFLVATAISGLLMTLPIVLQDPIAKSSKALAGLEEELAGRCNATSTRSGTLSLKRVVESAERAWPGVELGRLDVQNPLSPDSTVTVTSEHQDVAMKRDNLCLHGSDGKLISSNASGGWVQNAEQWLVGFHLVPGNQPLLRALHALGGLLGCGLVVSGMLLWAKRREREEPNNSSLIRRSTVAFSCGLVTAVVAMLLANRLLPGQLADRADFEIYTFWLCWGVSAAVLFVQERTTKSLLIAIAICSALLALSDLAWNVVGPGFSMRPGLEFDLVLLTFAGLAFGMSLWTQADSSAEATNA